tara:strand:- start:30749 stop:32134 length:1386 start_codon:yes stop_codon:yes gene_type:complete
MDKEDLGFNKVSLPNMNNAAAPELIPQKSRASSRGNFDPQIINVITDHQWTHTPSIGRNEVPRVKLSEYKIEFNSVMQQLRYLLTMGTDAVDKGLTIGEGIFGQAGSGSSPANEKLKEHKAKVEKAVEKIKEIETKVKKTVLGPDAGNFEITVNPPDNIKNDVPWLTPYWGLYGVQPTGFQYIMPYFVDEYKSVGQAWGDVRGGGIFSTILKDAPVGLAQMITSQFETVAKGAYIDLPKSYHYDQTATPDVKFTFYLYNTNSWEDVVKNWQLVFMLVYQNLANKTSKILLEPPVIYEVEVDGLHYFPYAYISGLQIKSHGTQREMVVPVQVDDRSNFHPKTFTDPPYEKKKPSTGTDYVRRHGTGSTSHEGKSVNVTEAGSSQGSPDPKIRGIKTQIPEAWEVNITLKSLLPETKNLMFHAITQGADIYEVFINDAAVGPQTKSTATAWNQNTNHIQRKSK